MDRFLTLTEVACLTGISRWTLRDWIRKGQGPPYKQTPGGHHLFQVSDLIRWFSELRGPAIIEGIDRPRRRLRAECGNHPNRQRNRHVRGRPTNP